MRPRDPGTLLFLFLCGHLEVGNDGLAHVLQCCLDRLALRHTSGELRHVSNVAVVFGVKDQVYKKLSGLSHARILRRLGRHEPKYGRRPIDLAPSGDGRKKMLGAGHRLASG